MDNNRVNDLGEEVELMRFSDASRLSCQEKLGRGVPLFFISTSVRWNTDNQFHPTKNRFMMELDKFKNIVLPKLNELYGPKSDKPK